MKTIIVILLSTLSLHIVVGQVGLIQDEDGWTNVRKEANGKSEIIHKIKEGELFWYDFEFDFENNDWIEVYIPEDNFTLNGYNGKSVVGFIHKSRLIEINNLDQYDQDNFTFEYYKSRFDTIGRKIINDNITPIEIDNKFIWGTDGYLPTTQVDSITIRLDGKQIPVEAELYDDIFNVRSEIKIYKIKNLYVVYHWNSDGAGSYEIAWAIDEKGIKQRLLGSSI